MSPQEIVDRLKRHGVNPNDVFNANGDLLENHKYHLVSSGRYGRCTTRNAGTNGIIVSSTSKAMLVSICGTC